MAMHVALQIWLKDFSSSNRYPAERALAHVQTLDRRTIEYDAVPAVSSANIEQRPNGRVDQLKGIRSFQVENYKQAEKQLSHM
jgi:hypothetical protein